LKGFYLRWLVLLILFSGIALLGFSRYNREVRTISPKALLSEQSAPGIRLIGMVEAGSLVRGGDGVPFRFSLSGEGEKIPVRFSGDDSDTLRELKTIVVIGQWSGEKNEFDADRIALVPNYGFITSAYMVSLIPLGFFLFYMERRVALLYVTIKDEKVYQAEARL